MDFIWILFAFICGLGMKSLSMPPLIGYLLAGFGLYYAGVELSADIQTLADLGITLMLFTIGLKLVPKSLLQPEVWVGTLGLATIWMVLSLAALLPLATASALILLTDLELYTVALVTFATSFSSTVCVVKVLEDNGEMKTRHGRLAIAILVAQDILAVLFLVAATGRTPSIWALALPAVILIRPAILRLIQAAGHGELLPLAGFFLAFGAYELFEAVNIKGDLGALLAGIVLSQSPKATELTKSLLSFKDLFLIGFFLSIGFSALPDGDTLMAAAALTLLLPLKFCALYLLLVALRLKARSAFLTALVMSNYSEFGLIVAASSAANGWMSDQWIAALALAVTFSFILTTLLYQSAHRYYGRYNHLLKRVERVHRLPQDEPFQPQNAEVLIIGLGRVGRGAFEALAHVMGDRVWGMDADRQQVEQSSSKLQHIVVADGEDADFWEQLDTSHIRMILLALPTIDDALNTVHQIRRAHYSGLIGAVARYEDERQRLLQAGIDKVFNFFTEAGTGFAEESLELIYGSRHIDPDVITTPPANELSARIPPM